MKENEIFLTGYAKLPEGITAYELYRVVALAIKVNRDTGEIIDADCTLSTNLAKSCIKGLLVGESIKNAKKIEEKMTRQYFGCAKKALITALRICHKNYGQVKHNLL